MRALKHSCINCIEIRLHVTTQAHEGIETWTMRSIYLPLFVTTQAHEGIETMLNLNSSAERNMHPAMPFS